MLHYWTRWRLDRGKLSSSVERVIVELLFKLGRNDPVLIKDKFEHTVDATKIFKDRKPPTYLLRPAVYRTLHGESRDAEFASELSRLGKK